MAHRFIINGKFLRAESTGVHRVAMELTHALADLIAARHPALADFEFEVWHTRDGSERAKAVRLPRRCVPFLTGIPWEQITLPMVQGSRTLLNFCNIGPVLSRNAITMIHDAQVHLSPASYRRGFRLWYRFVQPILGKRNRRILTVSAFSKLQLATIGLCRNERVGVVHNGADHILRVATDRSAVDRMGLLPHRYVVALSSTQEHKNIGLLLEAFSDNRLADIKLVLFGATPPSAFEGSGFAVPANVIFAGRLSDGELRGLLTDALCLAFPSTTEGFGLPPLEAMVVGCPVLAAPCGALPEVCGDGAIYVDAHDATAWVSAIGILAADPEQRAARVEAGKVHAAGYSWHAAALALVSELRHAI